MKILSMNDFTNYDKINSTIINSVHRQSKYILNIIDFVPQGNQKCEMDQ